MMSYKGQLYRTKVIKNLTETFLRFMMGYFLIMIITMGAVNYKSNGERVKGWKRTSEEFKQLDSFHISQAVGLTAFFLLLTAFGLFVTQKDN